MQFVRDQLGEVLTEPVDKAMRKLASSALFGSSRRMFRRLPRTDRP